MQFNSTSVHRGALFLSGVAAVALCLYGYSHLSPHSPTPSGARLHRSNATHRRRRRRSQPIPQSSNDDTEGLARAFEQLARAEESGQGFGIFNDPDYLTAEMVERLRNNLTLLPSRLDHIRYTLMAELNLSGEESEQLRSDILTMFMDNFITMAFPHGYYVAGDVAALQQALAEHVDPNLVEGYMELHYPRNRLGAGQVSYGESETDLPLSAAIDVAQELSNEDDVRSAQQLEQWGQQEHQGDGHQVLDLLYRIGEEQAKRDGYLHRGVQCNGCNMQPIMGIRYHCANCWDFDLCEMCEAQQIHHKTHVFYKIRIPAPTRGQIKLVQPKWYPGEPNTCPESIPGILRERLLANTNLKRSELDAFYDQFRCAAGKTFAEDPSGVCMAIDRACFDRYFTSTTADRAPTPNLIYDRIFSFYDDDGDGLISFAEFARGMADLAYNTSREARIQRLFKAFDIDNDGYVDRRDFLYLLQAHYNLNKELAHEVIYAREDALLTDEEVQEVIHGNNPISAAFGGSSFAGHQSRHGVGKHVSANGDLVLDDDVSAVLKEDSQMRGNRIHAIARQATDREPLAHQTTRDDPVMSAYYATTVLNTYRRSHPSGDRNATAQEGAEDIENLRHFHDDAWYDRQPQSADVITALGAEIPLEDVMDPIDRQRVLQAQRERTLTEMETHNLETERAAVEERWQRRQFYLDEEQGFRPLAAYQESDSSDEEQEAEVNGETKELVGGPSARRPSLRSRSSSKVRFEDNAIQSEYETKSDISSRNTPINERWGGFEFSQPDRDIGIDIIYEAVQEAFNDMLNHFFKEQEDKCMAAKASRAQRVKHKAELDAYEKGLEVSAKRKEQAMLDADMERTNALFELLTAESTESVTHQDEVKTEAQEGTSSHAEESEQASLVKAASSSTSGQEESSSDPISHAKPYDALGASSYNSPCEPDPHISSSILQLWHEHNVTDAEAKERNGYGRLNIQEFKRKLREEVGNDIDVGGEGRDDEFFWETKADLGKFSFLSTWIEMASF